MTGENRRLAIAREIEHGRKALTVARLVQGAGFYNDALSRLYYALFHHATALLLTEGIDPTSHRSLPGLLGMHFVLKQRLTAADIAILSRAASYRNLADYDRAWDATPEIAAQAFAEVEVLIDRFTAILREGGWLA